MFPDFLLTIFSNGEVVRLDSSSQLPGRDIIAIIHCTYDGPTPSGKNHHYAYTLFDAQLTRIESNCLEWQDCKCWIDKRDEWRPPHPDSSSNYEMRIEVCVEKSNGESVTLRFQHRHYFGSGITQLLEFVQLVKENGNLYSAYHTFKKKL